MHCKKNVAIRHKSKLTGVKTMRIKMQVWDNSKQCPVTRWVHQEEETKQKKKARYRGKNKIPNFKDKVEQRKKEAQLYKKGTVWTKSQQAEQMHAMRQCHSTETRYLYLERTGQLDTI